MTELGYRPNRAARTLATGKSQIIGVVAQNSTLYGPASLLAAFGQVATAAGFGVAVASLPGLDPAAISEAMDRHLGQQVAVDQIAGARLATQNLLDAGHATVWHISGPADWFDSMGRIEG